MSEPTPLEILDKLNSSNDDYHKAVDLFMRSKEIPIGTKVEIATRAADVFKSMVDLRNIIQRYLNI